MLPAVANGVVRDISYPLIAVGWVFAVMFAPELPLGVAFAVTGVLLVSGWLRRSAWAMTAPIVFIAVLDPNNLPGLIAWALVALGLGLVLDQWLHPERYDRDLADANANLSRERDALRDHLARYPLLLDTSLELSRAQTEDEMAALLADACRRILPAVDRVQVFTGDASTQTQRAVWTNTGETISSEPDDDVSFVASEARSLVQRDAEHVVIAVPMRGDRRRDEDTPGRIRRGVLVARYPSRGLEDHLLQDLVEAISRLGGLALASVDLIEETRDLALYDDLTGLFGRHEYLRRLAEAIAKAHREETRLGVVMIDMDHLKHFNDTWGHAAGDQALIAVASAIRSACPHGAFACRYGGEEFLAAIPGGDPGAAGRLADSILERIRALTPLPQHPMVAVTASLGWTELHADDSIESILARIDAAVYRAKDNGRNQVEAAS